MLSPGKSGKTRKTAPFVSVNLMRSMVIYLAAQVQTSRISCLPITGLMLVVMQNLGRSGGVMLFKQKV